jgi:hypothetical protein
MMTNEMISLIVRETNRQGNLALKKSNDQNPDNEQISKDTDSDEMWAFVGLLILAGVHRSKNKSLGELYSTMCKRDMKERMKTN